MRWLPITALLLALAGCPTRDIHLTNTPMWVLNYDWYQEVCEEPTPAELDRITKIWMTVLSVGDREKFTQNLRLDYKVRICLSPKPVRCGPWPQAGGCAGSNAILISRTRKDGGPSAMWSLFAEEMVKHLIVSDQAVLDWRTPEGLDEEMNPVAGGILADSRYVAMMAAVRAAMKEAGIPPQ